MGVKISHTEDQHQQKCQNTGMNEILSTLSMERRKKPQDWGVSRMGVEREGGDYKEYWSYQCPVCEQLCIVLLAYIGHPMQRPCVDERELYDGRLSESNNDPRDVRSKRKIYMT